MRLGAAIAGPPAVRGPGCHSDPIDPLAAEGGLVEAFDEVLDLGQHLLIPHGLGRPVDVHHHGPPEVGYRAGYGVYAVIVGERPAVFGDVVSW